MPPAAATPDRGPAPEADPEAPGFFRRNRVWLSMLALPVFVIVVGFAIYRLTGQVRYQDVARALAATPWFSVALAIAATTVSFLALTLYDVEALRFIGRRLPYPQVALIGFCGYAVGNIAGFGPFSGGAIRYRAYSRLGLSPEEIAKVIAFVTVAFGVGIVAIAALAILFVTGTAATLTGIGPTALRLGAGGTLLALTAIFLIARRGHAFTFAGIGLRLPDLRTALQQFAITCVDVAAAATVLYVLLPYGTVSWPGLLAAYSVALGLGVLSHVPGGLGVFETVMIATLGHAVELHTLLGALILYRVVYFILPLVVAVLLVVTWEVRALADAPAMAPVRRIGGRLAPTLLGALSLVTGVVLVFISVAPVPHERLVALEGFVPLPLLEGATFLTSLLGLLLIIASRGLTHRLDGAWWLATITTLVALALAPMRAGHVAQPALLCVLALALYAGRRLFTRPASLFREALTARWLATVALVLIGALFLLFFVHRDVPYSHELWWQFEFSADASRALRAMFGVCLAATLLALASLLRHAPVTAPESAGHLAQALEILDRQPSAGANLVRMGDKSLLFSEDETAFLMYGQQGRSRIALFDPVGPAETWSDLVWRFVETSREAGCRPVLYQVTPALLGACADAGLRAWKFGEMAVVDLTRFDLKGGQWSAMRNTLSRGQRDGLDFAVLPPAALPGVIDELEQVSDAWLAHHKAKEKSFSLGAFTRDYMLSQPVAVLRLQGRIVAFANLLTTAAGEECSIDLMRFSPEAPSGSMVFLLARTMLEMREQGVQRFTLGMAPLSGMSDSARAPTWDVIGGALYEHGERFYNFKGLRAFKEKFRPDWEPRYLAVAGTATPMVALMDATLLIGGGLKGVIGR